jgi:hypothetical protein
LSGGFLDEDAGNFAAPYWMIDSDPVNMPPDTLSGLVPLLPKMSQDDDGNDLFRLESLSLFTRGNTVAATGIGTYMQAAAGGVVSFDYEFKLSPNRSATATRILNVTTIQAQVVSVSGGTVMGFLINIVGNILIAIMKDTVVTSLENSVQNQIDDAVSSQLSGVPEGVTITALDVRTEDATGITVYPLAAVPGAILCELEPGSVRIRPVEQLKQLRSMRDKVMRGTTRGEAYIEMRRRHRAEMVYLLLRHPALLKQLDKLIRSGFKDFNARSPGKGVLSAATGKEGVKLLEMVGKLASPQLSVTARALIPEVKEFVGKSVSSIFKQ